MALPIPILMSLIPSLSEIVRSEHQTNTIIREIEAQENIERMKHELQKLIIEADNQKVRAQKEILQSLLNATSHVFDRKIDAFREAFLHSHSLVEEHQRMLIEEQKEINEKIWDDPPENQFLLLNNRLSEITGTLIDLKKISSLMVQEFNQQVMGTNLDMNLSGGLEPRSIKGFINE